MNTTLQTATIEIRLSDINCTGAEILDIYRSNGWSLTDADGRVWYLFSDENDWVGEVCDVEQVLSEIDSDCGGFGVKLWQGETSVSMVLDCCGVISILLDGKKRVLGCGIVDIGWYSEMLVACIAANDIEIESVNLCFE